MPMEAITRRNFLRLSAWLISGYWLNNRLIPDFLKERSIMTVSGRVPTSMMGFTLPHEHILVDFIGADKVSPSRYNQNEVFEVALPILISLKEKGCTTFFECTPAYLGRDVALLKKLSIASGLNIVTNTGYYGAVNEKYLPANAYTETATTLAHRWIKEWKGGIDGTVIKPGFIKISVDKYPLSTVQRKVVEAAAITHLATGLTIAIHTGDGKAAMEELSILNDNGVSAKAWIWIHAQNEKDRELHYRAARSGGWVEFDGLRNSSIKEYVDFLKDMKNEGFLGNVLISHDSGYYHVGEKNGGTFNDYNTVFNVFIPELKSNGFTESEITQIFKNNPGNAFSIQKRKKK